MNNKFKTVLVLAALCTATSVYAQESFEHKVDESGASFITSDYVTFSTLTTSDAVTICDIARDMKRVDNTIVNVMNGRTGKCLAKKRVVFQ